MDRNFPMRRCSWPIVPTVALRKESVDRNSSVSDSLPALRRRSPQGERG